LGNKALIPVSYIGHNILTRTGHRRYGKLAVCCCVYLNSREQITPARAQLGAIDPIGFRSPWITNLSGAPATTISYLWK